MILAGIDIGTNTLRLLVAETGPDSFQEIYAERKVTRLGEGLDRKGLLGHSAEERSLKTLRDFAEKIKYHAALHTRAIGTSALRTASNSAEFIEKVRKKTGLDIRVISGKEEARLTLIGVTRGLKGCGTGSNDTRKAALVIDIGGGSTEIIMTRMGEESAVASLPLGAVCLTDRYVKSDPPTAREMEQLRISVNDRLDQYGGMVTPGTEVTLVGTAGTITTLASMELRLAEYDPDRVNGHILTVETVDALVQLLATSTLEERKSLPGLEKGREDIILAGAVVMQEIMKRFGLTTMAVSDWGLREGIVLDLYEKVR